MVAVLFLGMAAVAMLSTGSVMGLLMCCAAIWVLLTVFHAP